MRRCGSRTKICCATEGAKGEVEAGSRKASKVRWWCTLLVGKKLWAERREKEKSHRSSPANHGRGPDVKRRLGGDCTTGCGRRSRSCCRRPRKQR